MIVEVRLAEEISKEDENLLFEWDKDVFALDSYGLEWQIENDYHFLLYENDNLVSHVGVLKHTVIVGEEPIDVGGIAAVVTIPSAQGKGYAHKLLQEAITFMCNELKVKFGMLFCRPSLVPLYEALGWQVLSDPITVDQPSGKMVLPLPVMVLSLPGNTQIWPEGPVKLESMPW